MPPPASATHAAGTPVVTEMRSIPSVASAIACVANVWNRTGAPSTYTLAAPRREPRIASWGAIATPMSPLRSTTPGTSISAWRGSSIGNARSRSPVMTVSEVSGTARAVSRGGAPEVSGAPCELRNSGLTATNSAVMPARRMRMTGARGLIRGGPRDSSAIRCGPGGYTSSRCPGASPASRRSLRS